MKEIYDLLEIPISKLTEIEKKLILETMSIEEFEQIQHNENNMFNLNEDNFELPPTQIKDQLMSKFQSYQFEKKSKPNFLNFPIELWKVAAVFLICFGGYHILHKTSQPIVATIEKTSSDTVILVNNIIQMDTIIVQQKRTTIAQHKFKSIEKKQIESLTEFKEPKIEYKSNSTLKVFDLNDLKQNYNHSSKYLNEDSLEDKIGFHQI